MNERPKIIKESDREYFGRIGGDMHNEIPIHCSGANCHCINPPEERKRPRTRKYKDQLPCADQHTP